MMDGNFAAVILSIIISYFAVPYLIEVLYEWVERRPKQKKAR